MYRLKEGENAFQVTAEGPFEYHTFFPGQVYEKVPEEHKDLFEEMDQLTEDLEHVKSVLAYGLSPDKKGGEPI